MPIQDTSCIADSTKHYGTYLNEDKVPDLKAGRVIIVD